MLLNASGCLDALIAPEVARSLDALVTKTITPEPREGNPPVRIAETDSGMLNSIGLANPGRERFLAETLPRLRELGVPLWISVGGFSASEYAETCAALEDVEAIELNLSCPNVDEAPEGAAAIVAACRAATGLPLYAKLSPAAWDIAEVARAVEAAGADGLSLVNTLRGLTSVDPESIELMRSYAARESSVFRRVRIPNSLPFVFSALKVASVLAMIGAVVGDYFGGSTQALGVVILSSVALSHYEVAWAAILVASVLGLAFYGSISLVERYVVGWHPSVTRRAS